MQPQLRSRRHFRRNAVWQAACPAARATAEGRGELRLNGSAGSGTHTVGTMKLNSGYEWLQQSVGRWAWDDDEASASYLEGVLGC